MKKIFVLIFLLSSLISSAQIYQKVSTWEEYLNRFRVTGMFRPPLAPISGADTGAFYYNKVDSSYYKWTGSAWRKVDGGGVASLKNQGDGFRIGIAPDSLRSIRPEGTWLFMDTVGTPGVIRAGVDPQYSWGLLANGSDQLYVDTGANKVATQSKLKDTAAAIRKTYNYIDVFLTGGQSNAQGEGDSALSPKVIPGTVYQWCSGSILPGNDPIGLGYGIWVEAQSGSAWPAFGIEYNKLTGRKICFVPAAVGATSQTAATDGGNGNWDVSGTLVNTATARLDSALADLAAKGYTPVFRGVLWHQGEFDANAINSSTITQSTYINALRTMIGRFRTKYGANMPFYIFRVGTQVSANIAGYNSIRDAQQIVKETDSLTQIVYYNCSDFIARGLMKDDYHYKQPAYNEMGQFGAKEVVNCNRNMWQPQGDQLYYLEGNVGIGTSRPTRTLDMTGLLGVSLQPGLTHPAEYSAFEFPGGAIASIISSNATANAIVDLGLGRGGTGTTYAPHLSFFTTNNANPGISSGITAGRWMGRISFHGVAGNNTTIWPGADIVSIAEVVKPTYIASSIRFATTDSNGTPALRVKINNMGNVGIGPAFEDPTARLHVVGTGIFTDTLTATTMGNGDSSHRVATTAWVKRQGYGSGTGSGTVTSVTATSPLNVANNTTTPAITIDNAAANGATKGAATFNATDFNDNGSGVISLDYTNGPVSGSRLADTAAALRAVETNFYNANGTGDTLLVGVSPLEMYQKTIKVSGPGISTAHTDSTLHYISSGNIANAAQVATGNYAHDWAGKQFVIDSIGNLNLTSRGSVSNRRTFVGLSFSPNTSIANPFGLFYSKGKVNSGDFSDSVSNSLYVDASTSSTFATARILNQGSQVRLTSLDANLEADSATNTFSRLIVRPHYMQLNAMDSLLINGVQAAATADSALGLVYSHGNPTGNPRTYRMVKFPVPAGSGASISDVVYGAGWDGNTTDGASKNALYDKISTLASLTGSETLTNKTLTSPVIGSITNTGTLTVPTVTGTLVQYKESSITSSATPSPSGDARENYLTITALATNATIAAPTSPAHNNWLIIEIKDDGTSRTLSWNAVFKAGDIPLPTATVAGKVATHHFKYSTTISGSGWLYVGQTGNF